MERHLSIFEMYLIEVSVMLLLVSICKRACYLFRECNLDLPQCGKARKKLAGSEV